MKSNQFMSTGSIALGFILTSSVVLASGHRDSLTAVSRGSHIELTEDLVIPANTAQFMLDSVNSRHWSGRGGVIWCAINLRESSLDNRQISAGRKIEFSGVVLEQGNITYTDEPYQANRIELGVSRPSAIRSIECSGARYDGLRQQWTPLGALVEDLVASLVPYGHLTLAPPREIPDTTN